MPCYPWPSRSTISAARTRRSAHWRTREAPSRSFSRLYQERGRCYVDLKDAPPAIDAFLQGGDISTRLSIGSWRCSRGPFRLDGTGPIGLPPPRAASRISEQLPAGGPCSALRCSRTASSRSAELRGARLLDHAGRSRGRPCGSASIGIARRGVRRCGDPARGRAPNGPHNSAAARREYSGVLLELHRYAQARAQIEPMLKEQPDNRELRIPVRGGSVPASRRSRTGHRDLPACCSIETPRTGPAPVIGHAWKKPSARGSRCHRGPPPARRRAGRISATRTGVSQPQDLPP